MACAFQMGQLPFRRVSQRKLLICASLLVLTGSERTRGIVVEPELVAAIVALNVTRRAQETPKIAVIRT
jgi:hypothetical protein